MARGLTAAQQLRAGRWAARAPLLIALCSLGPNAAAAVGALWHCRDGASL